MTSRTIIVSACAVAMLASFATTSASARTFDSRTYFTFSGPVELPGVMLEEGRYLFRIVDTTGSRRIVQVLSADGNHVYGMFHTIPAQRLAAPEQAELRFWETPSTMPPAIQTWWYPGNTIGREFIYSKERRLALARAANAPVLSAGVESLTREGVTTADLSRETAVTEEPTVTEEATPIASAAVGSDEPRGVEWSTATSTITAQTPVGTTGQQARAALPQTASALPLLGLIGLASLAGAAWLRLWR